LSGLEPLHRVQATLPRARHRAHRRPPEPLQRQELRRHPHGRGRHGPGLRQAARRHLLAPIGRLPTLRENARYVIGLGVKSSSSELLVGNCDEFIFYEDLIRESKKTTALRGLPEKKAEAFSQLIEAVLALQRENKDTLWGSMVKQT